MHDEARQGDQIMAYTQDNTEGYADAELAQFNADLDAILEGFYADDVDGQANAIKAHADAVLRS